MPNKNIKFNLSHGVPTFGAQLIGVISINVFVFIVSYIIWSVLNSLVVITLSKEAQTKGTDVTETGVIAYAIRD